MNNSLMLPSQWFRADRHVQLEPLNARSFHMLSPPEGGGVTLNPGNIPTEYWAHFDFVNLEVYHDSHDVLVLLFSFCDEEQHTIAYHVGTLPGVRTVICLPLVHLNGEKLFLPRFPGVMQTVLRGDAQVNRNRIVQFRISTIPSTTARIVNIQGLTLSKAAPDTDYGHAPYIDVLGQYKAREWQGKTRDERELKTYLLDAGENAKGAKRDDGGEYGSFGGWKGLKFEAKGYFRTEKAGGTWWFVDPEGYALFSSGMDCVGPSASMHLTGMEHLLPSLPDKTGRYRDAWSKEGKEFSFQIANLITAFGEEWRSNWSVITEYRLKQWGFNTIGNWSDPAFIQDSQLPYVYPMTDFPVTEYAIFRDFPDVFSPEYEQNAGQFARQLLMRNDDRRMIGYFMRNEPHWAFVDSLNLTEVMMQSPVRSASKKRFVEWLCEKYADIARLNLAWGSTYGGFEQLYQPEARSGIVKSSLRDADYASFNRLMIRRYVEVPARLCKQIAPNHLNLGMRYAWVGSDEILEGCEWFDVFSLNCYQFSPDREEIIRISNKLNRPVMIGEYHFGAADSGMLAYGIRAVATQEERGLAYRYFVEQAAAIPELIGVHYFQWNDQPVLGRFDGENYQIGVVDVCNRPYEAFIQGIKEAHRQMYAVRTGEVQPYDKYPMEIPKTGF